MRSNLYVIDKLGFTGSYRKIIKNENETNTYEVEGTRYSYGLFFEFINLRIFAKWFRESNLVTDLLTTDESKPLNEGLFYGFRAYF
ncbi:MAG: hypothetical protein H6621_13195 [Halobacteriovoraceae bacterium]|nr:hypothetical protein [Halobacteriovoraceae bacterium]